MSSEYTWKLIRGTRGRISFPVLDGADKPVPMTGWTIDLKVKEKPGGELIHTSAASHITLSATTHDGEVIPNSTITVTIPAPINELWDWSKGWYRIMITAPGGDPADPDRYQIIHGPLIMRAS